MLDTSKKWLYNVLNKQDKTTAVLVRNTNSDVFYPNHLNSPPAGWPQSKIKEGNDAR